MIFELYCVKDSVTGQFSKPELYYNKAHAVRHMNDTYGKSPIAGDISLYFVGSFNTENGTIESVAPGFVCNCEVIIDEK